MCCNSLVNCLTNTVHASHRTANIDFLISCFSYFSLEIKAPGMCLLQFQRRQNSQICQVMKVCSQKSDFNVNLYFPSDYRRFRTLCFMATIFPDCLCFRLFLEFFREIECINV